MVSNVRFLPKNKDNKGSMLIIGLKMRLCRFGLTNLESVIVFNLKGLLRHPNRLDAEAR